MSASARIPVSKERHRELHQLKEPGQTYDELLEAMIREYKRKKLFDRLDEIEGSSEFTPLEEL